MRLDARTEFEILERSQKGGWKLVIYIAVLLSLSFLNFKFLNKSCIYIICFSFIYILLLVIKRYMLGLYYVVIIYRRGTSVVRSLKLLAPSYLINKIIIILFTTGRYVISPYHTNTD